MVASPSTDVQFLRRALRDLVALSTLPAIWAGQDTVDVAQGLADTIHGALHPDLIYVCLSHLPNSASNEALRLLGRHGTPAQYQQIKPQLTPYLASPAGARTLIIPQLISSGDVQAYVIRIGSTGADGVIVVGSADPNFPSELDRLLLTVIANQAIIWSQQARLLASRQETEETLVRLNELGQVFAAELNLDTLLQSVTDTTTQLVGAEIGAFFYNTVNETGESFTLVTFSGAARSAFAEFPMPRATPLFRPTFHGTDIVRSGNIQQDARYGQMPPHHGLPAGHPPVTSYLAAPVIARSGRVLGGLFFGHALSDQFTEHHESLITGVAAQAAIAIDNAQLYQAQQLAREQLETRVKARTVELLHSETSFQLLVNSVEDYAIFMLDTNGVVSSWNTGAMRIKGYRAEEIIGQHFSLFYPPHEQQAGKPAQGLTTARETGHFEAEGWRVRKDGSQFWANVVITPVHNSAGEFIGFAKVTRDLTERRGMENNLRASREQLRQLSAHLEKAREQERTHMAREIHDELGGTLTGLKMDVAQLQRHIDPQGRPKLLAFSQAIDEAVQTVRRIATDLRPGVLDDFGLLAAMEWQLGEFARRSGIHCHWHCTLQAVALPSDSATAIFRVFQESLTNIARHARASEIHVNCAEAGGQLQFEIEDNGIGIAPEQLRGTGSLGLVGIRERMGLLGGKVDIHGRPGLGTTVAISLPLEPSAG